MMHFAADPEFNVYLASMKGDPKTLHILRNPATSLLILRPAEDMNDSREIEIIGRAETIRDERLRQEAFELISRKSPVVKYLRESNNTSILEAIKIIPEVVKFRVFREIVQGMPPTVFQFRRAAETTSEYRQLWEKLRNWWVAIRLPFLTAALVPILLGSAIGWAEMGTFRWSLFLLTLLAGLFLHIGTNVINDYYDYKSGNDEVNVEFVRPFSGGSRVIQLGLLSPLEMLSGALFFFILGAGIGLYLAWAVSPLLLLLGIVGVVSGFFYTAPPFNWASRGIGELLVGFNFGVLMTVGAYIVQTGTWSWQPVIASIPIALLIAAVLYINEFPDYKADKAVNKTHIVVRLGLARGIKVYVGLMALPYLSLVIAVLTAAITPYALIGLVTLPLALRAVFLARKYYAQPFDLAPANALTAVTHLMTGLMLCLAYVHVAAGARELSYTLVLGIAAIVTVVLFYRHIERQRAAFQGLKQVLA
jgi:1,4-dihydroxy-2-naphthoate octaprenyltransferase